MFLLKLFLTAYAAYCMCVAPAAAAQASADVTVFAAASLKEVLDELAGVFDNQGRGKVAVAYAASSALARQIEKGAPADVFISADIDWMDYLDQRKLLRAGSRINLASNRLVLIAPSDSKTALTIAPKFSLAAALGNGRLAIADPAHVPAGKYGKAALEALGVWPAIESKTARAENVRAALALVARGEAPLGIVYQTDAMAERKVRVVGAFSPALHPPIAYPAALLNRNRSPNAAGLLLFLQSRDAHAVWRKFGFMLDT